MSQKPNKIKDFVANMKGNKRRIDRKQERELIKLNKVFDEYCDDFYAVLFGVDWDASTHELQVFKDFNNGWIKQCEVYNKDKKHYCRAEPGAFYDLIIDNTKTNKDDKPFTFANFQQSHLRWTFPFLSI